MNRRSRRAAVYLGMLLGARLGVAAAQSDAPLVGPFTRDDYPQAIIDRPLTLPAGMVEAELGASFVSTHFPPQLRGITGFDEWFADVALRVGVTDRVQIEAATAFSLDYTQRGEVFGTPTPDLRPSLASWQHVVPVRLSFLALDTDTLDTAATLTVPFVAHVSRFVNPSPRFFNPVTVSNSGRVVPEVDLAAPTRWRLCDRLWLRAGEDLFKVSTGDGIATFAFDVGIGVQLHRLFAMTLDTRIASVSFDGSGHEASQTLADVGRIALTGYFTPLWNLDVVGSLELPDVGAGFDDWGTRVAVRYRL
jgi:hypothetical protein